MQVGTAAAAGGAVVGDLFVLWLPLVDTNDCCCLAGVSLCLVASSLCCRMYNSV
jgi:hypothetical protein